MSLCCLSGQRTPPHDMVLVYILFGLRFGAVRHLYWYWFIHTTKPEQQASKRMHWLPCIKHPCRTFAFLISTKKKTWNLIRQVNLCLKFRTQTVLIPAEKWRPFSIPSADLGYSSVSVAFLFLVPPSHFFAYHSVLGSPEAVFGFSVHSSGPGSIMWVTSQRPLEGQPEWGKTDRTEASLVPVRVAKCLSDFLCDENASLLFQK